MGAYSSFGSLSLTHHILVCGVIKDPMVDYAILGDDMTIDSTYGDTYLRVITSLGVNISLSKSLLNSHFIEFAKRLFNVRSTEVDAILGPKLILQSIQNKFFRITLLHESYKRAIINRQTLFEKLANPS